MRPALRPDQGGTASTRVSLAKSRHRARQGGARRAARRYPVKQEGSLKIRSREAIIMVKVQTKKPCGVLYFDCGAVSWPAASQQGRGNDVILAVCGDRPATASATRRMRTQQLRCRQPEQLAREKPPRAVRARCRALPDPPRPAPPASAVPRHTVVIVAHA